MYEAFYGFREKPFTILPDPGFLYFSKGHSMAYAMLEYGVMNRAGFTVITGEIGCGKTTLIRHLLNQLGPEVRVGLISNAQQDFGELLQWVLMAFGLDYRGGCKVELFDRFQQFLIDEYSKGRRTVLIIDEAQNLQPQTLEELRMLSNINADKDQLLQLILSGQPKLRSLLRRSELAQFSQRISADFHIKPMELIESIRYIKHRVKVAGRAEPLFTTDACALLHRVGRGVPRVINILADTALVYGFAEGAPIITKGLVYNVVKDKDRAGSLQLSHLYRSKKKAQKPASEGDAPAAGGNAAAEKREAPRPTASVVELDKEALRKPR
jgi:type II secretory pathway predicted ATPase ExeA